MISFDDIIKKMASSPDTAGSFHMDPDERRERWTALEIIGKIIHRSFSERQHHV